MDPHTLAVAIDVLSKVAEIERAAADTACAQDDVVLTASHSSRAAALTEAAFALLRLNAAVGRPTLRVVPPSDTP